MKLAIVGAGVSGLTSAWLLSRSHDITVFEAADWIGGHTHTVDVERDGRSWPIDTGFIVFNDRTYPGFCRLLQQLEVETLESSMSFSVRCEATGLEYNGTSLDTLFAQRRNLVNIRFLRMIRDILRFNRDAKEWLASGRTDSTVDEFLERGRYSTGFIDQYLVPMAAAVWSSPPGAIGAYPARFLLGFFANHGFLEVDRRPTWSVIRGGSKSYVAKLLEPLAGRVRASTPVQTVRRHERYVELELPNGRTERFDGVVLSTHSDQALELLADPSEAETEVLAALPYQANEVVLHTDSSVMPKSRRAWASWNYHLRPDDRSPEHPVAVTYWMNHLQRLEAPTDFFVTLNRTEEISPQSVLRRFIYHHPVFTAEGIAAQARRDEISGLERRTWYCGAYWRNGFHEDGVDSALAVCSQLGESL